MLAYIRKIFILVFVFSIMGNNKNKYYLKIAYEKNL